MELAQGMETAAQNSRELQQGPPKRGEEGPVVTSEVNQVATTDTKLSCFRCGKPGHQAAKCKFKGAKCHHCGKTGHLQAVCRSKQKWVSGKDRQAGQVRLVQEEEDSLPLFVLHAHGSAPPIRVSLAVDGCPLDMEVDTGAAVSITSQTTFDELWPNRSLAPSTVRLQSYSGEPISVVGSIEVAVEYQEQSAELSLVIVEGNGPTLLGRNWLKHIRRDWQGIHRLSQPSLKSLLQKHETVFQEGLGTLQGHKVPIVVDPQAAPSFSKARPIPYAMRSIRSKQNSSTLWRRAL